LVSINNKGMMSWERKMHKQIENIGALRVMTNH
jgi:hypothetical protein